MTQAIAGYLKRRIATDLTPGQLVGVHWNSRRQSYSIVAMKSRKSLGRVVGYADQVTLENCTTKIDTVKQQQVIEKGAKDRHAFIVGRLVSCGESERFHRSVYYKPGHVEDFVDAEQWFRHGNKQPIGRVEKVNLDYDHDQNKPVVTYHKEGVFV